VAEAAEGKMVSVDASTAVVRKKAIINRCNSRQVGLRTALLAVQANSPYAMTSRLRLRWRPSGGKLTGIDGPPSYEEANKEEEREEETG
jgi:hypothetical protein